MSLRTSAHTGVAIRVPAENPGNLVLLQANPLLFRIHPKYSLSLCATAGVTDCPVASLLAMTCNNLLPVHIIPGHCRYAAGKAPLPTCRAPPPCNRTHTPAFCMPLHPTPLQPQTRSIFLHVIANQCAHWCGNPRPRRESWQPGTTSGKSAAFPYSPKVFPFAMCYRRSYGLPRRFAPRNDMQ